ncbi:membrane bound O-acyl transferase family-domain-containing protein [Lanmaoa asiatica]|nr:membrane bound O-acyl transferase family-domain-containing protein [Lanmaoa asiatica]
MPWRPDILEHAFTFERAAVTPYTFANILLPAIFSFYAMAVLVQLQRAGLYRAALLPMVFWMTFRANMSLDFSWNYPGYAYLNQALALSMFTFALRSTTWVFARRPYVRLPICKSGNGTINGYHGNTPTEHGVSVSSAMWNAWDLVVNLRGIGWNEPQKMHIPTPYFQVKSRLIFSLLSLGRSIFLVLVFDIMNRTIRSFGPDTFGTPKGGTIFDPSLPPSERYMKSLIVTLLSGISGYIIIEAGYQLHAALFTVLFQQHPSQWPPLFDSPWLSTSLASFWGRRWHQLFRESFVAIGSRPMERYLGRTGVVMGAFAVSGVLHDVGLQGMGQGADTPMITGFFLLHGVGIVMEHAWKQVTGRRVSGIIGWLWVTSWTLFWGHLIVDVWARRGLIGSEFCPEAYRPTTLFLNWISRKK